MEDQRLEQALERAEFALRRITRSIEARPTETTAPAPSADMELRTKVNKAIAELDDLIREVSN